MNMQMLPSPTTGAVRKVIIMALCLGVALSSRLRLCAQEEIIFQIGTKDQSSAELARPEKVVGPIVFRVGRSRPELDWPAYQPGSFDDYAKHRAE
jgi:hypothetical protein